MPSYCFSALVQFDSFFQSMGKKDTVKICMDVFVKTFQVSISNCSLEFLFKLTSDLILRNRRASILTHVGLHVISYIQTEEKSVTLANNQRIVCLRAVFTECRENTKQCNHSR